MSGDPLKVLEVIDVLEVGPVSVQFRQQFSIALDLSGHQTTGLVGQQSSQAGSGQRVIGYDQDAEGVIVH